MTAAAQDGKKKLPATPWGLLPPRLRVLLVAGPRRTGGWLADALAADSAAEVELEEAVGEAAGLARLREDVFDAVLIDHAGEGLDAFQLLDAIRAGSGDDQPVLVLGTQSELEMSALCYEAGADAYVFLPTATTRALIWMIARARERHLLIGENRRLLHDQRHRLQLEHEEAARLLQQQRALIVDLEHLRRESDIDATEHADAHGGGATTGSTLPAAVVTHYRELLRAYVIMGSGNLTAEMNQLAERLAAANATAHQALTLHLHALEEVVRGLGNRSARHVLNRADLLILEVMINLAEGYRQRFLQQRDAAGQPGTASRDGWPLRAAG